MICSSPDSPLGFLFSSWPFEPFGEMGMVVRSTGDAGFSSVEDEAKAAAMTAIVRE